MGLLLTGPKSSEVHLSEHLGNSIQSPSFQQEFILHLWRKQYSWSKSVCLKFTLNLNGESSSRRPNYIYCLCTAAGTIVLSSRAELLHRSKANTTKNVSPSNLFTTLLSTRTYPKPSPSPPTHTALRSILSEVSFLNFNNHFIFRTTIESVSESTFSKKSFPL